MFLATGVHNQIVRLIFGVGLIVLLAVTLIISNQVTAQTAPTLGTALNFAVLAGSTVTNIGPSVVNGNLGVSPGSAVTGFPPGSVTPPATIHAADGVALQAQNDVTAAYVALTSQPCDANLAAELGGATLIAGVYCIAAAQLTGALTLDSQGNPDAVFIFKIASTLITASNASVTFINGGNACNVWWQVGSSATLGTTTSFAGNILALESITLNTGVTLSGRALARNGAVTMDTNTIGSSLCNTMPPPNPGLSLVMNDGGVSSAPGETVIYTLNFQNTGNVALDNVTLTDIPPAETTFNAGESTAGWSCPVSPCTFNVGTLSPGQSGSTTFAVSVNNPTSVTEISNSASIASGPTTTSTSDTTPIIFPIVTEIPPVVTEIPPVVTDVSPVVTEIPPIIVPGATQVPLIIVPGATTVPTTNLIISVTTNSTTNLVAGTTAALSQTLTQQANIGSQGVVGLPNTGGGPPQSTYWIGRPSR